MTVKIIEETKKDGFDCLKIEETTIQKMTGEFEQNGMPLSLERETKGTEIIYFAYKKGMFLHRENKSNAEGIITVVEMDTEIPQIITTTSTTIVQFDQE